MEAFEKVTLFMSMKTETIRKVQENVSVEKALWQKSGITQDVI